MVNWEFSEKVKSAFVQENQNGQSQVFNSQMYSNSLTCRQNLTMKHQHEMKEEDQPWNTNMKWKKKTPAYKVM